VNALVWSLAMLAASCLLAVVARRRLARERVRWERYLAAQRARRELLAMSAAMRASMLMIGNALLPAFRLLAQAVNHAGLALKPFAAELNRVLKG
jgi:hypothetical protein